MKLYILLIILLLNFNLSAQHKAKADFELGSGLTLDFDEGNYVFNIAGSIQPYYQLIRVEDENSLRFAARNAFFSISEQAKKEKIGFVLRADFARSAPLMDAYLTYQPWKQLKLSFGQRQNFGNNREMLFLENALRFSERSILSTSFSGSGREFGIFAESKFSIGNIGIAPKIAVTTGDGRNSFGASSTDTDLGGFRYSGRLDVYPLGFFEEGNDEIAADFAREKTPKIAIGGAYNISYGASDAVGEGHGDFNFYNENLQNALPNYWKQYIDILVKWQGLSLMGEFVNSSSDGLIGLYIDPSATTHLQNGEISNYLSVGRGYHLELGYVLKNGFALDVSYGQITPEFPEETASIIQETKVYTFGLTKYIIDNRFRVQANYAHYSFENTARSYGQGEIALQLIF